MFKRVVTFVAVTAALSSANAQARPMQIEDLLELQAVTDVSVSPDGAAVAYLVADPRDILDDEKDGPADVHLHVARDAGAGRVFVGGEVSVSDPQWTRGATAIAFRAKRDGDDHAAVHVIAADGGEASRLYAHGAAIQSHAVSADGNTLWFVAADPDPETKKKAEKKGFKAVHYEDGLPFAHLWRVDLAADEPEAKKISTAGHFSSIALSPDGRMLAAAVAPTPTVDDSLMRRRIHVLDATSGEVRATVQTSGKLGGFAWSPSGDAIAFTAGTDRHDPADGVLMLADTRTGAFTQLTPEAPQHVQDVAWLNDREILAVAHRGVESALVVYDRQGRERRTLETSADVVAHDVEVRAGRIAMVADSPAHPGALYVGRGGAVRDLWAQPNEWLAKVDLVPQTTYRYQSRDGRQVEGLLMVPAGAAPDGGWPLILVVHGGPEAHYSDGWLTNYSTPGQIGAARGFAVYMPNYLGSTGRGVEWTKAHQGDYAGREFDDLVDAKEALVRDGLVNAQKVGITGGSYGGYAAAWGATAQSEHFAAAVAMVAVTNQLSQSGTTDIPDEKYLVHARKRPWDDWMNLLERSPVFHAGNSRTPTLILHGDADPRVHPSQSLELYRHLKLRSQAPVRLVLYPGEGHGNRNAAARHDYTHRLMRWMEHYLTGPGGAPPPFDLDPATMGLEAEGRKAESKGTD